MQKTATIAVISTENKLLILQRGSTAPWMPNRYCLPGGKQEENESLKECAARELEEETQIYIKNTDYLVPRNIIYTPSFSKLVFVFKPHVGEVILNWEHNDYKWVTKEESKQYKIVPSLKTTIKYLYDNNLIA